MFDRRYWLLRILSGMILVVPIYFGMIWADGRWWLQLAVALVAAGVFTLLEAPLSRTRKRRPFR